MWIIIKEYLETTDANKINLENKILTTYFGLGDQSTLHPYFQGRADMLKMIQKKYAEGDQNLYMLVSTAIESDIKRKYTEYLNSLKPKKHKKRKKR